MALPVSVIDSIRDICHLNGVQLDARNVILRLCEDIVAPIAAATSADVGADHGA